MIPQIKISHYIYGLTLLFLLSLPLYAESDFVVAVMPDGLSGSALLHVGILIFMFAYLSSSWNILGGFAGQLSLGHAAFFGIGAYTSSLIYVHTGVSPWIGMIAGAVIAAIVGYGLGFISFKYGLKGPFFALVTIAFAEILRLLFLYLDFTGGPLGLLIPLSSEYTFWEYQFLEKEPYYYIALGLMVFGIIICAIVSSSKFGYYLRLFENQKKLQRPWESTRCTTRCMQLPYRQQ